MAAMGVDPSRKEINEERTSHLMKEKYRQNRLSKL